MGLTALHIAAFYGKKKAARLLLSKGSNPNIQNKVNVSVRDGTAIREHCAQVGSTALHLAARKGHKAIVMALLENDADKTIKDNVPFCPITCHIIKSVLFREVKQRGTKLVYGEGC